MKFDAAKDSGCLFTKFKYRILYFYVDPYYYPFVEFANISRFYQERKYVERLTRTSKPLTSRAFHTDSCKELNWYVVKPENVLAFGAIQKLQLRTYSLSEANDYIFKFNMPSDMACVLSANAKENCNAAHI